MKERRASLNLPFNSRTELIQIVPKLTKSDKNQVKLSPTAYHKQCKNRKSRKSMFKTNRRRQHGEKSRGDVSVGLSSEEIITNENR